MSHRHLIKLAFFVCALNSIHISHAQESGYREFLSSQNGDFAAYQTAQYKAFSEYAAAWQAAQKAYLKKIKQHWQDGRLPDQTQWVTYSPDLNNRTTVDYKNAQVVIEVKNQKDQQKAIAYAKQQLEQLATSSVNQELKKDPVYNANKASQPTAIAEQKILPEAVVKQASKQPPIKVTQQQDTVKVVYQLAKPELLSAQAAKFYPEVQKQANKYGLDAALLLAIIHTESSFNPLARSPVPAFGLMQIVPGSAGKDVSKFLQGKSILYSPDYLYQADKNVEAGSVYFYILSNRYFKSVKNPVSRIFLSIAAYNTGPGNVARTLTGTTSLTKTSAVANQMTPKQIYQHLYKNLPYDETKHYLARVTKRTGEYQQKLSQANQ
ncbi:transglycosylase SLT domain-containing protein [Gayadomonas joobiniege]|uniref:transglycosylase SLT domain-containing protein n=1 Tax=Gayadomonas joobiniege TaxID=1234606 RepID=UPI00037DFA2A|nr:transglycosylase SLT domain-containing protein [Gayadomonas joobiniege]